MSNKQGFIFDDGVLRWSALHPRQTTSVVSSLSNYMRLDSYPGH